MKFIQILMWFGTEKRKNPNFVFSNKRNTLKISSDFVIHTFLALSILTFGFTIPFKIWKISLCCTFLRPCRYYDICYAICHFFHLKNLRLIQHDGYQDVRRIILVRLSVILFLFSFWNRFIHSVCIFVCKVYSLNIYV